MKEFIVHRCRMFNYNPCAIHGIALRDTNSDMAVSRSNGDIEIWSTIPNCFPKLVISGASGSIEAIKWVGNRLISGGINGDITEYDLSTGTVKLSVDSLGGAVWCLCSSPSQTLLAAGCEDGSVKLFDLQKKSIKYERAFDKQEGRILSIAWHIAGDVIVTGSTDIIRLWNFVTGHAIQKITLERVMRKLETIVWSIAILSDFTVVSGDSNGRVEFWNGRNGTLYKSFNHHRADVLCLCVGSSEDSIFASGVDSKISEFNRITPNCPTSWVAGRTMRSHVHDVRALAVSKTHLFSGGVDTQIITKSLATKDCSGKRIHSFPSKSLVSVSPASRLALYQYRDYLEVWKVAESRQPEILESGMSLPIEKPPIKLVRVNKPKSDVNTIKCSSLSPCGKWLVYSTAFSTRLYRLTKEDDDIQLRIERVHCIGLSVAHHVVFTANSSHMIISSTNHKLLFVKLNSETSEAYLFQTVPLKNANTVTHLLTSSKDSSLLASADIDGEINIFDITTMKHVVTLPRYQQVPTSMSFLSDVKKIMIAYSDMQVLEYDLEKNSFSQWTKDYLSQKEIPFLRDIRDCDDASAFLPVVTAILHQEVDNRCVSYFVSSTGLYVLERKIGNAISDYEARFCKEFSGLLYADFLDDRTLLAVERPYQAIFDQLPPTLYQKKFGV